jgi:hypothetical protein
VLPWAALYFSFQPTRTVATFKTYRIRSHFQGAYRNRSHFQDTATQRDADTQTTFKKRTGTVATFKTYRIRSHFQRHADTQTRSHADTQTRRHSDTQTQRHADTQSHRNAHTQTRSHTKTQTSTKSSHSKNTKHRFTPEHAKINETVLDVPSPPWAPASTLRKNYSHQDPAAWLPLGRLPGIMGAKLVGSVQRTSGQVHRSKASSCVLLHSQRPETSIGLLTDQPG